MTVGKIFAPEWNVYQDPLTSRQVLQLTDSRAEDYHLYFYNPSFTPDGKYLVFFSERTGVSNLFRLDLQSGIIVQLTDARPVRGEYWPFTDAVKGVSSRRDFELAFSPKFLLALEGLSIILLFSCRML